MVLGVWLHTWYMPTWNRFSGSSSALLILRTMRWPALNRLLTGEKPIGSSYTWPGTRGCGLTCLGTGCHGFESLESSSRWEAFRYPRPRQVSLPEGSASHRLAKIFMSV